MNPGQSLLIEAVTINGNDVVSTSLPDVTYSWQIVSGSGVTISGASSQRLVAINANATGTATLRVTVEQGATSLQTTSFFIRDTVIQVKAVGPTPTPVTPPKNPGPVPASIPNSKAVLAPEGTALVASSGSKTGTNPQVNSLKGEPVIFIPVGSVRDFFGVDVVTLDVNSVPAMPSGVQRGSSAAEFFFVNQAGEKQSNFRLLKAADVCLPTTSSDTRFGFNNAHVYRFNSTANQWVQLNSTYNTVTGQLCAKASNFSTFAIGLTQQAQATATPDGGVTPPATGGWTPGPSLLLFAGLVGFVLVGGGAFSMRRARKSEINIS